MSLSSFNPISAVRHFVEDKALPAAEHFVEDKALPAAQHLVEDKALPVVQHFVKNTVLPPVRQIVHTVAPPLAAVRDAVRDRAVSTWNKLPGHERVESTLGNLTDHLPFNNAAKASLRALAGQKEITLDKDATDEIQRDPGFLAAEKEVVGKIKDDPRYGKEDFDISLSELYPDGKVIELGGQRGNEDMWYQLRHALDRNDPEIRKTWGAAGNELTWLLRHCHLDGKAHVAKDGSITIEYTIKDHLDLTPGGRSDAYDKITTVTGTLWHGVLGAGKPEVTGTFTRTVPA